ncbi:MAG: Protein-methionine-sulfoxide reductase catalytic subunit MsrP [Alphaproteobacteria bacterium MarineAlpha5_Bin12]|nr:protein-methionine-sulfoxide reductase catalytic subunit MsrP [Pelagibacteraceae bacterium]PPR41012.1 MAG: Protein-methionine-sulfoxide reductase catalytic subunit MsrP [Alphaproteobacteria bacterium MarineAlpha5_Bin12]|tara:strand:- start:3981 stop:4916 length:936 start_codon:yes stop_codon:yes gene_type:complete
MKKIKSYEITSEKLYFNRRFFIKAGLTGILSSISSKLYSFHNNEEYRFNYKLKVNDKLNDFNEITTYNNFYEFGMDKSDPYKNSGNFKPLPWSVKIEGLVEKEGVLNLEDLIKDITIEDRIYRLRCVEGWSMVIPWQGFSLSKIIKKLKPLSNAKYLQFETVYRPEEMPGQKKLFNTLRGILPWPYVEGLRMDEAMHPLTILSTGLYGHDLLNQNGAPLRLVVPWKYGFKSIKSIVAIRFVEKEPSATWSTVNPREYGFYSNVNPNVDHPRWSQATERRIGEFKRRPTEMFNGYGEEVSHLYNGMDLIKYY